MYSAMPCTVGTRHYIDGGGLQHSWYPHDVCRVGEDIFVALHNNEYKLKTFFRSKDLSVCPIDAGFLQHLRELRNVAVDRILLEHFRKELIFDRDVVKEEAWGEEASSKKSSILAEKILQPLGILPEDWCVL